MSRRARLAQDSVEQTFVTASNQLALGITQGIENFHAEHSQQVCIALDGWLAGTEDDMAILMNGKVDPSEDVVSFLLGRACLPPAADRFALFRDPRFEVEGCA